MIEVDVVDAALEVEDTLYPANVGDAARCRRSGPSLAANPSWVAVGIDDESAFNLCSRAGFLNERATMPSVGCTTPA